MAQLSPKGDVPTLSPMRISRAIENKQQGEHIPQDTCASSATTSKEANLEPQKSSMYPGLHNHVVESLEDLDYTFRNHDTKVDIKRQYDTNIIGKFECPKCQRSQGRFHTWHSNCIAITIWEYEDNSYNALVYHQLCSKCKRSTRPTLDKLSYSDRVAYRLKKWNGIEAIPAVRKVEPNGDHKEKLCQGCKKGHCSKKKWAGKGI
ncbi:hypothetical protein FSPOR_7576 [Fusarium sporotrichioides]|uniref:3CxxC-type domain-containing protein n=1 Tax=Fusarium sporotrichioides TaxID=5514 RepID=A0A395RYP9_FUSSP|nr:hypothetical protein FSPOR_7576 [Fusarium sporotrichioides]